MSRSTITGQDPVAGESSEEKLRNEARGAAREYAWNWFQYHAGQRQAVFRFYLLVAGAISTGYFTSMRSSVPDLQSSALWFGLMLAIASFLFWRLDFRNAKLVKLAEDYLKQDENELATIIGSEKIRIVERADVRPGWSRIVPVFSFSQLYRAVFLIVGGIGLLIFVFADGNPIVRWATRAWSCIAGTSAE